MNSKMNDILIASALSVGMAASPAFAATPFAGPYLGAQMGHSVHDLEFTATGPVSAMATIYDGLSTGGTEGGPYAGWGMKITPAIYGGVEAEYSWSAEEHTTTRYSPSGSGTLKIEEKYNYGISARLGWLPTSSSMLYLRAGWQRANLDYLPGIYGMSGTHNRDHDGLRLGFGAEFPATSDWLVRVDYGHTSYEDVTLTAPGGESLKFKPTHNVFRLGIARQF